MTMRNSAKDNALAAGSSIVVSDPWHGWQTIDAEGSIDYLVD